MELRKLPMESLERIHVVPYTHTDYAWTNPRQWHVWRYLKCFCELLDQMRVHPELTWSIDNVLHSLKCFETYCPERMDEFVSRVQEGRIRISGGGMALARPNCVGEETWVRNAVRGKRYMAERFGIPMEKMTYFLNADTGIGHSQMPQLLQQMGYDSYRSMRPEAVMNFKQIPRNFIWKGLDGSRITVSRGEYGGFLFCDWMREDVPWQEQKEGFLREDLDKLRILAGEKVMMLYDGCDDVLPLRNLLDREIPLFDFMARWNREENSRIFFSTPEAFFEDLRRSCVLPEVAGPLDQAELSFNPPIKGERSFWRMRRALDGMLTRLESVNRIGAHLGLEDSQAQIDGWWDDLLEIAGHAIEFVLRQDEEALYERSAAALLSAKRLLREKTQKIAQCVACGDTPCFAAVNPLGWERKAAPVRLHVCSETGVRGFRLTDGAGRDVPYQIVDVYTGEKAYETCELNGVDVIAWPDVPAFGVNPLRVTETGEPVSDRYDPEEMESTRREPACEDAVWEDGAFRVEFRGGRPAAVGGMPVAPELTWHACEAGPHWVPSHRETGTASFVPEKWGVRKSGPLLFEYRSEGRVGPHRAAVLWSAERGTRELKMDVLLDAEAGEGFFTADFAADPDTPIRVDVPFGAEDRDLQVEPGFAFRSDGTPQSEALRESLAFEQSWRGQFYARSWVRFCCGGLPVTLMNTDGSIYYQFAPEEKRVSMMLVYQHDLTRKSDALGMRWVRQTPSAAGEIGKCAFHLILSTGETDDAKTARRVRELQNPLLAAPRMGFSGGWLRGPLGLIGDLPENLVVTAFYRDGGRTLLRFYEAAGRKGDAVLPLRAAGVKQVDLLGRTLREADEQDGNVKLHAEPWKICTLAWYETQERGAGLRAGTKTQEGSP